MYKSLMLPYVSPLAPLPTRIKPVNHLKSPLRAMMFDVYGTLFISASGEIGADSENKAMDALTAALLEKYEIPLTAQALKALRHAAIASEHAAQKNMGIDFPEVEIDVLWMHALKFRDMDTARKFAIEYEMIHNPAWPMPHLQELLEILRKKCLPAGIISNAQFFTPHLFDLFCENFPEHLGFAPDLIFYSYQYGHAKPSPVLFDQAVQRLSAKGIQPQDVCYVGNDMRNDITAARNNGFQTCLYAGDSRSLRLREDDPECRSTKPDAVIKDLIQLGDMIG